MIWCSIPFPNLSYLLFFSKKKKNSIVSHSNFGNEGPHKFQLSDLWVLEGINTDVLPHEK